MATLGCSLHVAYIQGKCNGPRLCELLDASQITYSRRLDDISTAQVIVPITGNEDTACCTCLGDAEPWCHQLTIVREGDGVVWTGPIQQITYDKDFVTIDASDKLAVLLYRVNEVTLCYGTGDPGCAPLATSFAQIARDIIEQAVASDDDSQCFLDCIVEVNSTAIVPASAGAFVFEAFGGPTAFDDLSQLGEAGMDFTVINQCLLLMNENLPTSAIGILTDEMILGDVQIIKNGTTMGNTFYVRYDGDDDCAGVCTPQGALTCPCPGVASGDEECYGSIERIIDGVNAQNVETANRIAQLYLDRGRIAPRQVILPSGTRLSPDTPWGINDMIPGQRVDVAITKLCFPVFQSFKLQGVDVTDNGVDEEITIDLLAVEQTS